MKEYPQSFNAMDLVAEHRLRALHASWAYIHKADGSDKLSQLPVSQASWPGWLLRFRSVSAEMPDQTSRQAQPRCTHRLCRSDTSTLRCSSQHEPCQCTASRTGFCVQGGLLPAMPPQQESIAAICSGMDSSTLHAHWQGQQMSWHQHSAARFGCAWTSCSAMRAGCSQLGASVSTRQGHVASI